MKRLLLFFISVAMWQHAICQPIPGLRQSNYGGLYRASYNPSVLGGSKLRFQLNIGTIEGSINHRYFRFIGKNSLLYPLLVPHSTKELYGRSRTMGSLVEPDPVFLTSEIRWPSVLFSVGQYHGFAVQLRTRGYFMGRNIPEPVKNAYFRRLDTGSALPVSGEWGDFDMVQQSFSELSFSYGLQVLDLEGQKLRLGVTAKRVFGARVAYLKGSVSDYALEMNGQSPDDSNLILNNFNYESAYSGPTKSLRIGNLFDSGQYGSGWGFDMGFTYELGSFWESKTEKFDQNPAYVLRLSGSLTDIGSIKYQTEGGMKTAGFTNQAVVDQATMEKISDEGAEGFMQLFNGESKEVFAETARLPQAFHLEADVQVFKNFYLNMARSARLGDTKSNLLNGYMPNSFTITPRFEDEDSDFAFPISFVEGNKGPVFGALAHFGPVFLGFSNLNVIFSKNSRGSMVYLGMSAWKLNRRK